MSEDRTTRRDFLVRTGKLSLALGAGALTGWLTPACDSSGDLDGHGNGGSDAGNNGGSDAGATYDSVGGADQIAVEDVGGGYYTVATRSGLRTLHYVAAEA